MQAWQQVQVSSTESQHTGRAGYVVRSETKGEVTLVTVKLDELADPVVFDAAELRIL